MAFCDQCGARLQDRAKFCAQCGAKQTFTSDLGEFEIDFSQSNGIPFSTSHPRERARSSNKSSLSDNRPRTVDRKPNRAAYSPKFSADNAKAKHHPSYFSPIVMIGAVVLVVGILCATMLLNKVNGKPSEKVVKDDVQAHISADFKEYEIQDFKIVKSITEDKYYYVDVEYTVKKAFVEGKASGRLYYQKYDGGKWVLENAIIGEPEAEMVALPTEKEILTGANGLMHPLEDILYRNRLFNSSTITDIQILNIEWNAENFVYADISWIDNHDGYSGQMYGAIEISFFMGGYLQSKLLGAYHGEIDMGNLNGKNAELESEFDELKLKIEACTSEKLILNLDGVSYEYIRDIEKDDSMATRFYYVPAGENIKYYDRIGWSGVNRSISKICLMTRKIDDTAEDGDVILALSEGHSYNIFLVVQNG